MINQLTITTVNDFHLPFKDLLTVFFLNEAKINLHSAQFLVCPTIALLLCHLPEQKGPSARLAGDRCSTMQTTMVMDLFRKTSLRRRIGWGKQLVDLATRFLVGSPFQKRTYLANG